MRERIRNSPRRRSPHSSARDRDENEWRGIHRRYVSSFSGQSQAHIEPDVDGIRREYGVSGPYEVDRRRNDEERDAAFADGEYRNISDSPETVQYRLGDSKRSAEEMYSNHDAESSRLVGGFSRSTMKQRLSDEPELSRYITSNGRNSLRNNETDRLESNSRDYSDSSSRRLKPYPTSEMDQTEAIFVAMKGEHYSEDGGDRDSYIQATSPLSQVGSSVVDSQDESSRLVSLNSRCCVRVDGSDRVDERRLDYSGNHCASQVLQTRHFDDYVGRNSPRDQQEKSFRDLSHSRGFSCGDHSPAVTRCGKEIVDESHKNDQLGSDIAVKEFPCVRHDAKNMARETDLFMRTRGSLSKSYVRGSHLVDVDADNTHLEFCTKERMSDQYDSVKEHYPFAELGSSVVNERDDKAHHYKNVRYEQRKVVSLDNKCQPLRKGYQSDGRMYLDRNDIALQGKTLCLNKEREAYLDNERKAFYSDNKRQELRKESHFGNDDRMHSDVHGADSMVERDGRVVQLRRVCLNKGKAAYLDSERDVYLHHKNQQLKNDYYSGTDARIYPDVSRLDIVVDREDARGLRYRGVSLNDRKEAYLQCESQQLLLDHETDSYGMMHPHVNESNILVEREDPRGLKLRGGSFDDGKKSYWDNERGDACQHYENQQPKKDYDYRIDDRIYRDVNSSDIIVDHGDARALELRRASFDDGKESYLNNERGDACQHYENQQLKKDYDYGIDDRIYRDVNSSDIIVDHGDARALERGKVFVNDGNKAYLDAESKDVYMHNKSPQPKKDYDSGIDARMYPDVNRSEIVVEREVSRPLQHRGVSLNDGREAYLHYESQQLLNDHESDSYGMMQPDVSRSSAGKQHEEALRCRRYLFDDRNQVHLDDERLQLRNGGHVKAHANMRYLDGREKVYHSNEYGFRDEAGEVIHENRADDYNEYCDVKQLGMSYEKPDNGRFRGDHEVVAYDYRDKLGRYGVEGGTSTEQSRYLVDERSVGNEDHTSTSLRPRPRISAKDRLGGRVEDSRVEVKYRVLHQVRNLKRKGKFHKRN